MSIKPCSAAGSGGAALVTLIAVALVASGCATALPRSAELAQRDEALAGRVYVALNADPIYFFRHVEVRVDNGVADLSGYVWGVQALYRAREITRGVPGVTRVVTSGLELERGGPNTGRSR